MIGFNFLAIKFAPEASSSIFTLLTDLGFICISVHKNDEVSFWRQGNCMVQLQMSDRTEVSGMGLLVDCLEDIIENFGAEKDLRTGWYKIVDPTGFEIYLLSGELLDDAMSAYTKVTLTLPMKVEKVGLKSFTGLIRNQEATEEIKEFYGKLGFKYNEGPTMSKFISTNNQFTLVIGEVGSAKETILYVDTDDIFTSLATLISTEIKQIPSKKTDSLGLDLDYQLSAYGASGFGNSKSYAIEKVLEGAFPFTDVILRERKQKIHISEENIKSHYCLDK
jgi:hypothetical protein